jgi:UDP-glucose 4-epimerase
MKVLVTGGAGFIGSHVAEALLAAGHAVRVLDLRPPVTPEGLPGGLDYFEGDLLDRGALHDAMAGIDATVHLAAIADANAVMRAPAAAEAVNSRGTLNVLESARERAIERVVYASTVWVYSDTPGQLLTEETPLLPPRHLYTATKLAGEHYCRAYSELYGLATTVVRLGVPYGPRAWAGTSVHAFVNRALRGERLQVFGDGRQSRRFVYVSDLAEGVALSLQSEARNRTYNLEGDEPVSILQLAKAVQAIVGDVEIDFQPARPGDFGGKEISNQRARDELGWSPRVSFEEGLRRYVAWCRDSIAAASTA